MLQCPDPSSGSGSSGHSRAVDEPQSIHASCVALDSAGVLLTGPSGAGKSDLALRLVDSGFSLVSDDRVCLENGIARSPASLAGLIEVRGVGILRLPFLPSARLLLHVVLGEEGVRLPRKSRSDVTDCVLVHMRAEHAGAVARIRAALLACRGDYAWHAGAGVDSEINA